MVKIAGTHESQTRFRIAIQRMRYFFPKGGEFGMVSPQSYRPAFLPHPDLTRTGLVTRPNEIRLRIQRVIELQEAELHKSYLFSARGNKKLSALS